MAKDPYFSRSEVSNSNLTELSKYWLPPEDRYDIEAAYRFGTLIDMMITEPWKVNFFKRTCDGEQYTKEEFAIAEKMKASFWADPFCAALAKGSEMQKVSVKDDFEIQHGGIKFYLPVRCKWDLYAHKTLGMTGDIKSTTATTEKQFIAACEHFQYFRQRAMYMDIETVNRDMLIGISKVNFKVFKVPIERGGTFHSRGKEQYSELAFKWWYLFGDLERFEIAA